MCAEDVNSCLSVSGELWEKTISFKRLDELETAIPKVLSKLSLLLPSWELDMNRHMMLHMAQPSVQMDLASAGPCLGLRECGTDSFIG